MRLPAKKSDLSNSPSRDFFQRLQNVHVAVLAQVREVQGAVPDIVLLRWGYARGVVKAQPKLRIQIAVSAKYVVLRSGIFNKSREM